jgi:hypothetical protein
MLKRPLWMMVGAGFGVGLSIWTRRVARRTMARLRPTRLSTGLVKAGAALSSDLQAALAEGRQAMRQRESELRRPTGPPTPARSAIEAKSTDHRPNSGARLSPLR